WGIDAGLWVEPELNTIGGESLARQILYGQRYSQSRFGQPSEIAWLPDSFGFSWQLPQLLKQGKIDYFATQKLRWNDTTTFPYSLFKWEGLDGTQLLSLTLPPIGSDIAPAQMATHGAEWEAKTGLREMLWLPGMGDHGGGPTRDMLEKARRWTDSPFFPNLTFTSVANHLKRLLPDENTPHDSETPDNPVAPLDREDFDDVTTQNGDSRGASHDLSRSIQSSKAKLPVWRDELYLELHRGCYTTHADQKWFNRRCEQLLVEAELFAALGAMQGVFTYPKTALETAWKQVLFNQFHDILPGTAIPEVFVTANQSWQAAHHMGKTVLTQALQAIADHILLPSPPQATAIPLLVFNALNWERTDLVEIALHSLPVKASTWGVFDPQTQDWLPTQLSPYASHAEAPPDQASSPLQKQSLQQQEIPTQLLFGAQVPSVGYRVYWLIPKPEQAAAEPPSTSEFDWQLENDFVRVVIDPITGDVAELWEKSTQTNLVRSPANQLQAFQDEGQYWDAWDIAPDYAEHPLPPPQLKSITWLESGLLRQRLQVVRELGVSTFQQDYVLDQSLPYLKVVTVADWQASQTVLKAAFPLTIEADHATFEIPFGAIARSTNPTDPHEKAKWEVPALRWADLSNQQVGLSILTDYKHGFDTQPQQLRLTLLKAPIWPDPTADRGRHTFTYALYPHRGDWRESQTPHQAIAFNTPLHTVCLAAAIDTQNASKTQNFPSLNEGGSESFLSLGSDKIHLAAFKQSEDDANTYVLRCWDLYGQGATLDLATPWGKPTYQRTDLLETEYDIAPAEQLTPWQIATLRSPSFINES
ncbi:MAG: alpha-mannosidase, partial [Leptolyngbya sp. SIO1D8]|nr:alpha-mannosidase [Leptolyngbya sp. SIO1D8]